MPTSGGTADKLGNRYETLWAIDQLLRIVDGAARWLTSEPLDPDEARGVEFTVSNADGTTDYWSVKRQTTKAAGWTLGRLAAKDERGRTILGDLLEHVERDPKNCAVFASTLGARDFEELRAYAKSREMLEERLAQSAELNSAFCGYVLPLCGGDTERALTFLRRARTHAIDEAQLLERVNFTIRKLLYAADGSPLDVAAVRGQLADLLLGSIHRPLDRGSILDALAEHGIRLREWALDKSVLDRVEAICEAYTAPLRSQLINDTLLPLAGSETILSVSGQPIAQRVLVVGGAGGGKSSVLAGVVERLRTSGVAVLTVRFDQLPEGILTTTELGRKLLLPESPALTLAGVASGAPFVLLVDQLDAVSIASGRRAELWSLFEELRREVERLPGMSLIVGCREFDLEHDHRMRAMKTSGFTIVKLAPLSIEQVDTALRGAGVNPSDVQSALKPVLVVPLHLSMFLSLAPIDRVGVGSRDELLDKFWTEGERRTDHRLGRKAAWTQVIDLLANWLSTRQQLSAPGYVFDDFRDDAVAMASEHVLILSEGRYRFFHESFFDYAFARRFAAKGGRLLDLLLGGEQHLFRRAQVRQVLAYLRAQDWPRYMEELEAVLGEHGVRFHIKRLVFQWLSYLPDPQLQEWRVLQKLLNSVPDLRSHVHSVTRGHSGWFDVLDAAGFFDGALSSKEEKQQEEVIWMFSHPQTMQTRSARVAALLRKYRIPGEPWSHYLRYVCRIGYVYFSREMFDLFLSLIDDGTLDGVRPGFAVNDDWWSVLYSMAQERPELACEAIGQWFDRALVRWRLGQMEEPDSVDDDTSLDRSLSAYLNRSGKGVSVIRDAAKNPLSYAEQILPRVAAFVNDTAEERTGRLCIDPLWSFRSFGDNSLQIHGALLSNLAISLEALAKMAPEVLDRLLAPYQDRPHDAIAYLVLRAWTAAPEVYAEHLADYLARDARRLKVGYASWGGNGGSAESYVASQAVRAASARCSPERFVALENAILSLRDDWESKHPEIRGFRQLELLQSLAKSRLSASGRAKLNELRRKFPGERSEPPRRMEVSSVESPVPEDAQAKMTDEQWLRAMRKYAGVDRRLDRAFRRSGGMDALAYSLQNRTRTYPGRFVALAERMPDDLPTSYFEAILRGVADHLAGKNEASPPMITLEQVTSLVRRVHALPGPPGGQDIARLIKNWVGREWPEEVVDIIAWYAVNDPDPDTELWRTSADSGQPYNGGDAYRAGINSTRGAIAGAIARLLFDQPEHLKRLQGAVDSLVNDRSIAVRSCVIEALLAVLNVDVPRSLSWFLDCISLDQAVLETPLIERFVHYAGYRDYPAIRPVVDVLLRSSSSQAVEAGARQVCLLALDVESAMADVERVHSGTPLMRKAAADVYSTNVADDAVGPTCRQMLKPFFADLDESVRTEAASAFRKLGSLTTADQADLLGAFLKAAPTPAALETVVHALEDSPVPLPELVCELAEKCVEAYRAEAGDISKNGAMVSMDLSKIVVRLYAQTEDPKIQSRCLNLIDEMERHHFLGLSDELQRLDR
ncbi:MAG TPA: hypothetical protein VN493_02225 [Thermoanaerobaculia bacterium]|nr:hypothetical protein [Thermoanaerobaculia bacterium]